MGNKFEITSQTYDLTNVRNQAGEWFDDVIDHRVDCTRCGRSYQIFTNTYHGTGNFTEGEAASDSSLIG
ncbi:MAG: hypothetical protein LBJ44_03395 [Propionibacteriaceae bacterium]|nr:hypothetical protein [Propionibacteriaceae bacterium]